MRGGPREDADQKGLLLVEVESFGGTATALAGVCLRRMQTSQPLKFLTIPLDDVRADHVDPLHPQRLRKIGIQNTRLIVFKDT